MIDKKLWLELIKIAKRKSIIYYENVAEICGLDLGNPDDRNNILYKKLAEINEYEHIHNRPLLTAVVVLKNSRPPISGHGFFDVAFRLGVKEKGEDCQLFHAKELRKIYNYWENKEIPKE